MNAVNKLAGRYGIEESYRDARGRLQTTTPETRQALLAAMGVQANTEEAAVGALEQLEREEWLRPLPSAHVALEAAPISVPITYASGTDLVTWRLSLESGEERSGKVQFEALKLLHRQQLDDQTYERRFLPLGTIPSGYHRLTLTPGCRASCQAGQNA
jgi:4-alpha-glucanotransferase